jgi:hypothetical protein
LLRLGSRQGSPLYQRHEYWHDAIVSSVGPEERLGAREPRRDEREQHTPSNEHNDSVAPEGAISTVLFFARACRETCRPASGSVATDAHIALACVS